MGTAKDIAARERKIDEALEETFPASDTPSFVGGAAPEPGQEIAPDERGHERGHDGQDRMTSPPPAVGAYWINEADYPALIKIFDDGHRLPRTWTEWLKMAEEMERGLKAYGHVVMRVTLDPVPFAEWCAANGVSPGREGRKRFVAAAVAERYGDQR